MNRSNLAVVGIPNNKFKIERRVDEVHHLV
jgi:hypothetical protein